MPANRRKAHTTKISQSPELKEALARLSDIMGTDVYKENIDFWERAWAPVKAPYTQLPDLPYLEKIPEILKERQVKTVLDLGCGSGWLSIYLARHQFTVTGVDVASRALSLAAEWAQQEDLDIEFDVSDIADLPYPMGSFDAVVANSIFEHLNHELAKITIARLGNILMPGGLMFAVFDKVGGGPGEYYKLDDGTHVYTDKGRKGMILRCFSDREIKDMFDGWHSFSMETIESGSRLVTAVR